MKTFLPSSNWSSGVDRYEDEVCCGLDNEQNRNTMSTCVSYKRSNIMNVSKPYYAHR